MDPGGMKSGVVSNFMIGVMGYVGYFHQLSVAEITSVYKTMVDCVQNTDNMYIKSGLQCTPKHPYNLLTIKTQQPTDTDENIIVGCWCDGICTFNNYFRCRQSYELPLLVLLYCGNR